MDCSAISLGNGGDVVLLSGDYNWLSTGSGNDTVRVSGRHNVIDAGGGLNFISDGNSCDTSVLGHAGQARDRIDDFLLGQGDVLDLHTTLAGTCWDGSRDRVGARYDSHRLWWRYATHCTILTGRCLRTSRRAVGCAEVTDRSSPTQIAPVLKRLHKRMALMEFWEPVAATPFSKSASRP